MQFDYFLRKRNMGKTNSTELFNLVMGSYNEAEVCAMVGLFLLNEIKTSKHYLNLNLKFFETTGLQSYKVSHQEQRNNIKST